MKLADLPVLIGVFLLGLAALIISGVLQLQNGSAPAEYINLAATAMGVLGGAYMAMRTPTTTKNEPVNEVAKGDNFVSTYDTVTMEPPPD